MKNKLGYMNYEEMKVKVRLCQRAGWCRSSSYGWRVGREGTMRRLERWHERNV